MPWRGRPARAALLLLATLAGGCQAPLARLQALADAHGRQVQILPGASFPLAVIGPAQTVGHDVLRVYLEGDGHAWSTPIQPSRDPSPRDLLVAGLALADPMANLYLARPCQFVRAEPCTPLVWTHRRYAPEVLESLDRALTDLKRIYGNRQFELIGYSGGGTLALLLASRRTDVVQVQTLAGNLSPRQWVKLKHLTPLEGSLEPLDYRQRLAGVPQRHLFGADDATLPPALFEHYRNEVGPTVCAEYVLLAGVSHAAGWAETWRAWRERSLECPR